MPFNQKGHHPLVNALDPITLEVIRQDLVSIPNQIDKNIVRTAFSAFISEYKDYSVGIVDVDGKSISQSRGSLAIFVANALGTAVRDGLALYGKEGIRPGDVIISNHAGTLGQHLNNVVMYTPVHAGPDNELVAFFCVLMHWIDIGGMMVGSCSSTVATEIFQEGLHLRTVRIVDEGRRNEELFRVIQYNTRFPDMLMGDIDAQLGGCEMGRQLVAELAGKYGVEAFKGAIRQMWDHSDALVRSALAEAIPGEYEAYSFLDNDGVNLDRIIPVAVKVKVDKERVVVDFSGVSEQLSGPFNAGRNGGAVAAARIAMKYMFSPGQPVNEGDFHALEVEIPDGKFISAVGNCAMGSSGNMIPTVVDTVMHALSKALPGRGAAAHHGTYGVHAFHGTDPATGKHFYHLDTICGGWGATSSMDGYGPSRSNVHGDTGNVPIEMQEMTFPYRLESYTLRQDSGGPGRFRGGIGMVKTYLVEGPCRINLKIDRTKCRPWGLDGGREGMPSEIEIHRTNGLVERPLKGDHPLAPGDRVIVRTAGGGGYGPPKERDPRLVAQDVRYGYVSSESAREDYGVVLMPSGEIDDDATCRLRSTPDSCVLQ